MIYTGAAIWKVYSVRIIQEMNALLLHQDQASASGTGRRNLANAATIAALRTRNVFLLAVCIMAIPGLTGIH